MSDTAPSTPAQKRRVSPALALWLLAPVFGELVSGSTPLNEYISPFTLVLCMLYGSGALLIREALVRWGRNWRGLLLLGAAYGIFEEGLVVRSFFDPRWADLDALGVYGRAAGVNWVWTEHLIIFHTVISIAASIAFTEIVYPNRRAASWLGPRGLRWNLFALAATLPLGALMTRYNTPDIWLGVCWLAIVLLTLAAWRTPAATRTTQAARVPRRVPRPRRFWWTAFLATFGQFLLIYFPAEQDRYPFVLSMAMIASFDLVLLRLILRWSGNARAWDDRHRLALVNGSLSFFLLLGPLIAQGRSPVMYVSNPILLLALWWVARRVNRRVRGEPSQGAVVGATQLDPA